jgi:uncharacterized membrane protein (DUF485 family)
MNIIDNNSVLLLYPGFMRGQFLKLSLALGILFGIISGLMTFLITYHEYIRHYPTKKEPRKMALKAALVSLCFFFALSVLIGFFLMQYGI